MCEVLEPYCIYHEGFRELDLTICRLSVLSTEPLLSCLR